MSKVSLIIAHPIFKSACAGAIGALMVLESHPLYAGFAFGVGAREFLLAFKK
ncbi:MAG: hypothetical protein GOVbin3107_67 [Prokaryotic dsDNA virus sp.]|nr:MAG: hypothetical protein GOVbin3107_67 [Prokaryotic dsDNA virus sp.]|tara:strand:- start:1345 stop:1500 length:156 start_codon:yes stop_codon:yes gene_type:complete